MLEVIVFGNEMDESVSSTVLIRKITPVGVRLVRSS